MPNTHLNYEVLQLKNTVDSLKNTLKKQEEEKIINKLRERVSSLEKEIKDLKDFKKINDIKAEINTLKTVTDPEKKNKNDKLKNIAKNVAVGAGGVGLAGTLLLLAKKYGVFDKISKVISGNKNNDSSGTDPSIVKSSNFSQILDVASRILKKPISEIKNKGISDEEKNTLMRNNINPSEVLKQL